MSKSLQIFKPVTGNDLLLKSLEEMSSEDIVSTWEVLTFMEKKISERLKEIRSDLLSKAEEKGDRTEKGHDILDISGSTVIREKRGGKKLSEDKVIAFLDAKKADISQVYDTITSTVFNPKKAENLVIKLGGDPEGLAEDAGYALKVKPSDQLSDLLEAAETLYLEAKTDKKKKK